MERRLTAILAADVVGYSRLMELDEVGTLAALKAHREELIDPAIAEHRGRIVKLMGDGTLVEFASVVDAVTCAVAIQKGMTGRNDSVADVSGSTNCGPGAVCWPQCKRLHSGRRLRSGFGLLQANNSFCETDLPNH